MNIFSVNQIFTRKISFPCKKLDQRKMKTRKALLHEIKFRKANLECYSQQKFFWKLSFLFDVTFFLMTSILQITYLSNIILMFHESQTRKFPLHSLDDLLSGIKINKAHSRSMLNLNKYMNHPHKVPQFCSTFQRQQS